MIGRWPRSRVRRGQIGDQADGMESKARPVQVSNIKWPSRNSILRHSKRQDPSLFLPTTDPWRFTCAAETVQTFRSQHLLFHRVVSTSISTPRSLLPLLPLRRFARSQLHGRAFLSRSSLGLTSRWILPRFTAHVTKFPSLKQDQRHRTGSQWAERVSSRQGED